MAATASQSLLLVSMALSMGTVVSISSQEKGVIRREALDQTSHVKAMSIGEKGMLQSEPEELIRSTGKVETIPQTNKQYVKMATPGKDECEGAPATQDILTKADCEAAAGLLGLTVAANITINNYHAVDTGGVLLVVKKCYLNTTSNKVFFNPTEANATAGEPLEGTKICWRPLYHMAAAADGSTDDLCTDDAKKITNLQECITAMTDAIDGDACRLDAFKKDQAIEDPSKPIGCWRDNIGCWSFNEAQTFSGGTDMTQVCKCAPR
jgi:hypothetical protein